jgi:hypothetical protein
MSVFEKTEIINAHGEERMKKHVVDNGKIQYFRREKYCVTHGWIDVLALGGDVVWHQHHDVCLTTAPTGELIEPLKRRRK